MTAALAQCSYKGMDSTIEKIKAMRCDVRSMPYNGGWAASLGGGSDYRGDISVFGDTLDDAIDQLHTRWVAAGSPPWRVFTPEEAAVLKGECDQWAREAAAGKKLLGATGSD